MQNSQMSNKVERQTRYMRMSLRFIKVSLKLLISKDVKSKI